MGTPAGQSLFTGKGTSYSLETSEVGRISELLEVHPLKKWGFVVYRCTYGNDFAWARFMERLSDCSTAALMTNAHGVIDPDDVLPQELAKSLD